MSKVQDVLVKNGILNAEAVADESALITDFLEVYAQVKAGTLTTNAAIGTEIKKAFTRQDRREERKAERISARVAARQ